MRFRIFEIPDGSFLLHEVAADGSSKQLRFVRQLSLDELFFYEDDDGLRAVVRTIVLPCDSQTKRYLLEDSFVNQMKELHARYYPGHQGWVIQGQQQLSESDIVASTFYFVWPIPPGCERVDTYLARPDLAIADHIRCIQALARETHAILENENFPYIPDDLREQNLVYNPAQGKAYVLGSGFQVMPAGSLQKKVEIAERVRWDFIPLWQRAYTKEQSEESTEFTRADAVYPLCVYIYREFVFQPAFWAALSPAEKENFKWLYDFEKRLELNPTEWESSVSVPAIEAVLGCFEVMLLYQGHLGSVAKTSLVSAVRGDDIGDYHYSDGDTVSVFECDGEEALPTAAFLGGKTGRVRFFETIRGRGWVVKDGGDELDPEAAFSQRLYPSAYARVFCEKPGSKRFVQQRVIGFTILNSLNRCRENSRMVSIFLSVAQEIKRLGELGIVHRDLNPGNILIDAEGNARIIDGAFAYDPGRASEKFNVSAGECTHIPLWAKARIDSGLYKPTQRDDVYALLFMMSNWLFKKREFIDDVLQKQEPEYRHKAWLQALPRSPAEMPAIEEVIDFLQRCCHVAAAVADEEKFLKLAM